jgi:hypothetical protein
VAVSSQPKPARCNSPRRSQGLVARPSLFAPHAQRRESVSLLPVHCHDDSGAFWDRRRRGQHTGRDVQDKTSLNYRHKRSPTALITARRPERSIGQFRISRCRPFARRLTGSPQSPLDVRHPIISIGVANPTNAFDSK